jgi:hypothetical protein
MRPALFFFALALLLDITSPQAATLPALRTAYDAQAAIDFGTLHINSTVNADGPKERRIFDTESGQQTVIIRHDQGKIYWIIPALNVAMSMDNGQIPGGYDLEMLQTLPVAAEGTETVNGLLATRYKVTGQSPEGSFDGQVWSTANGIILKVDGTVQHDGKTTPVKIALSNLQVWPQNPLLFEVPNTMKIVPYAMAQMLLKGSKALALPAQPAGK